MKPKGITSYYYPRRWRVTSADKLWTKGWTIGCIVLGIWTFVLFTTGYHAKISFWIPACIAIFLLLVTLGLSGGSDGTLAVISVLFWPGWLAAYWCGDLFAHGNYGIISLAGFFALSLQGLGVLFIKSIDNG